jgi:hypothetical protein
MLPLSDGIPARRFPDRQCVPDRRQLRRVDLLRAAAAQTWRSTTPRSTRARSTTPATGQRRGASAGSLPCFCMVAGITSWATCCSWRSSERTSRAPAVPSSPCWAPTSCSTRVADPDVDLPDLPRPDPGVDLPRAVVLVPAHRSELRAVQRLGEPGRRGVLRPRRRVHLRPAGSTAPRPGGTGGTRGATAFHGVGRGTPSPATGEARRPWRRCASGVGSGIVNLVTTYQQ